MLTCLLYAYRTFSLSTGRRQTESKLSAITFYKDTIPLDRTPPIWHHLTLTTSLEVPSPSTAIEDFGSTYKFGGNTSIQFTKAWKTLVFPDVFSQSSVFMHYPLYLIFLQHVICICAFVFWCFVPLYEFKIPKYKPYLYLIWIT